MLELVVKENATFWLGKTGDVPVPPSVRLNELGMKLKRDLIAEAVAVATGKLVVESVID